MLESGDEKDKKLVKKQNKTKKHPKTQTFSVTEPNLSQTLSALTATRLNLIFVWRLGEPVELIHSLFTRRCDGCQIAAVHFYRS